MLTLGTGSATNRHARRKVAAIVRHDPALAMTKTLTTLAHTRLVSKLRHFGNTLSARHEAALMRMLGGFSLLASRQMTGRYAFPLDTGCGKSQGVVAWIAAAHELDLGFSVAVSAHKVEALCTAKRDLMEAGVPGDMIGLWHSHPYSEARAEAARKGLDDDFASVRANADATNHSGFQFLLLTHNRVRGAAGKFGAGASLALTFKDRERDLMIWDESLLISDHRAVTMKNLERGLGWWKPDVRDGDQTTKDACAYVEECFGLLDAELERQKAEGRGPELLTLPHRDPDTLENYLRALPRREPVKPLATLIEISQNPVRAVTASQGGGAYISYEIAVPRDLQRIAVLDASWPIRRLEQLDGSIRNDPKFDGKVKSYGRVTVNYLRHSAGRDSTERSFGSDHREERTISKEIAAVIGRIPADEGVLIFTFRPRRDSIDIPQRLRRDLEAAGIDTSATVETTVWNPETKTHDTVKRPRIAVLTFGNETSLSEYSYCKHVLFCGVLFRSDDDLAGAIVGQRDALLSPVTQTDISDIRRSEAAHVLYQALSRGACRLVDNGEAHPMTVYLMHPDPEINGLLRKVMPGVVIQPWTTTYLRANQNKIDDAAEKIAAYLRALPSTVTEIASRRLKQEAGLSGLPSNTYTNARQAAERLVPWKASGQRLVRVF